jgi:hypothetical protein
LIGAAVVSDLTPVIWMLRDALEDEREAKTAALDRDLMTAAMYIEYAGAILVEAIIRTPHPTLGEADARMTKGGPLYKGEPGLRAERWLFWLNRFKEEASRTSTEEAELISLRASRLMEVWVEKRLKPPK